MKEIFIPIQCPTCGSLLINNGPYLECSNPFCCEVQKHKIMKWIQKMDIMFLSDKTIEKLMYAELVNCISDLYFLTLQSVQELDGFGEGFKRVIDEIQKSKNPTLAKFMAGFDIDGIGERIWNTIIKELQIKDLDDLFSKKYSDFLSVNGIGGTRAEIIEQALKDQKDELIHTYQIVGCNNKNEEKIIGKLSGKSFAFTGALPIKRAEAEKRVIELGGIIGSVNKNLTYLVSNDFESGSAKAEKAKALGIILMTGEDFLKLIN